MHRRNFFGWVAGALGLSAVSVPIAQAKTIPQQKLHRQQVKDYILMMLGAPVVKIEMAEEQLDLCYDSTMRDLETIAEEKGMTIHELPARFLIVFDNVALAKAQIMLGRIRSKYQTLHGFNLIEHGNENLKYWISSLLTHLTVVKNFGELKNEVS